MAVEWRTVKVKASPAASAMGSFRSPVWISDPSVSHMMATEKPRSSFSFWTRRITPRCHSWSPWHMLSRATFIPLEARRSSCSYVSVAGPIVHTILVRRADRNPAARGPL